jgi:hypothetical protein
MLVRRSVVFVCMLAVFLACSSDESGDLCGSLADAGGCGSDVESRCSSAISAVKSDAPSCSALVDALTSCMAGLTLSCSGSDIVANGSGDIGGGQNFARFGDTSFIVNDARCDVERRGLEACRTCPDAVGATKPGVLGIGDRCDSGSCASGLTCEGAICTRACTSDDDCKARADECKLQFQYANVCKDGKCTRSCGDDYSCHAWVSASSKCADRACTH